ncbi:PucR family transcriptional regulator [Roseobacter weihaiensis]|uniref:PucR family transcriptional regulator n=1 Tax=Roseobacter weihaiensis TaxID=2763262 RepID=UPI001D0A8EEC|nr:PucR family transcriptional regulator [Roseobacter sp. H9]
MTTVITRYFSDAARARAAERELRFARLPKKVIRVYTDADGLVGALTTAHVEPATAEAYEHRVANGGAVVLVVAGYKPLGVAQTTREIMAKMGAVSLGNLPEEVFVPNPPVKKSSILSDHPRFLTRDRDPSNTNFHMADWPIPLISRRKPYADMLFEPHARMANWPFRLITRHKPRDEFIFPRHARMANILLPLTIRRKPSDNFAFPRHARMANWPLPLISRRKPYAGSLIGRHPRMASWPFPHLINGKTGTNAVIPDGPRMAAFPIPLLSARKPIDKFAFPRHARMADLILPLLSRRKPFMGSVFPRHARMANFPLPLLTKRSAKSSERGAGFMLSKLFKIPTVIRR